MKSTETERDLHKREFENSEFIFTGRVLKITPPVATKTKHGTFYGTEIKVFFQVRKNWKGVKSKTIAVTTSFDEAMCGYPFRKGLTYLVYADLTNVYSDDKTERNVGKQIRTGICDRTQLLKNSTKEIEFLEEITKKQNERDRTAPKN